MRTCKIFLGTASLIFSGVLLTACASSGTGGSVHSSSYYGPGWNDPMYNNHWHNSPDIIVVPPPRPERPNVRPPVNRPVPARPRPSRR